MRAALLWFIVLAGCAPERVASAPPPTDAGTAADVGSPPEARVLPEGPCAAGTFAQLGEPECTPVGWTGACPPGFARDASGWACEPPGPAAACAGAARPDVGDAACVPVGDCSAAFPPPEATLFVDAAYAPTQLDATHFRTIPEAVTASRSGATIAIAAGEYRGSVGVLDKSLTLVGRCAARVTLRYDGGAQGGIYTNDALRVRGVTVTGFPGGVLVEGGSLELEDSVVHANSAVGVYVRFRGSVVVRRSKVSGTVFIADQLGGGLAVHEGARAVVEDSALVDNVFADLVARGAGTAVEARGVVLARNVEVAATKQSAAVIAEDRAEVKLARAVVDDASKVGLYAATKARIVATETVIRRARGTLKASGGVGVFAAGGGRVELASSALLSHPVLGAYAAVGGLVSMDGVVVRGPAAKKDAEFGRGAQAAGGELVLRRSAFLDLPQSGVGVQEGGTASLTAVLVRGAYPIPQAGVEYGGFGVIVEEKSQVALEGVTLEENTLAALGVNQGSRVDARRLLVRGTRPLAGVGIGSALQVFRDAEVRVEGAVFDANTGTSVLASTRAKLEMIDVAVRATKRGAGDLFGHGLTVFAADATLQGVTFEANEGIAFAAEGEAARVRVVGGAVRGNVVGVHVQSSSFLSESDAPDELAPGEVRISTSTRFEDNGTRVGSGVVPLPRLPAE